MMKILAVCGSGMGTSMIMKMKVAQVLKKLDVDADVNSCSLGEAKSGLANAERSEEPTGVSPLRPCAISFSAVSAALSVPI